MDPKDYGLDEGVEQAVETFGQANAKPGKIKVRRVNKLDPARIALESGRPIPFLIEAFGSLANPWQHKFAVALYGIYAGVGDGTVGGPLAETACFPVDGRPDAIAAFKIGGCNTYAKLLLGYRDILLASASAGVYPDFHPEPEAIPPLRMKLKITSVEGGVVFSPLPADEPAPLRAVVTGELETVIKGEDEALPLPAEEGVWVGVDMGDPAGDQTVEVLIGGYADDLPGEPDYEPGEEITFEPTAADDPITVCAGDLPSEPDEGDVFKTKTAATAAAKAALGEDATAGLDFDVVGGGKRWSWAQKV